MRHLQITNEAIVPVLNVTRLKHIKNSPFTDDKSQKSGESGVEEGDNHREGEGADESSEEVKIEQSNLNVVDIVELSGMRKICKPVVAL